MKKLYLIRANKKRAGGAEIYLSQLSAQLDSLDVEHEIICSHLPKILPSWVRVAVFNLSTCLGKNNKFYFSLDRISCPDIYRTDDGVHKVFLTIENKSKTNLLHRLYLYLERKAFQRAKKIIAISHMVKNNIIDSYDIDPSKIVVVHNGINLETFNSEASFMKVSKEFEIEKGQKIITYVGSGFKRKGVEEFLHIIAKLTHPHFKAFIIGKEKNLSYYKHLALKLGVEKKVIFTGSRNDVKDFYTVSDIFLFPTRYDPFGNVILEAMNFSNVVFTTSTCGASDILDSEFIMQGANDFSVAEKMDNILSDDVRMDEIKAQNLKRVQDFTIEKNVEETLKVIHEVID